MKSALDYMRRQSRTKGDLEFIDRWSLETNDPIWERLARDIIKHDEILPNIIEGPYSVIISSALSARRWALGADSPSKTAHQQKEAAQKEHDKFRLLASKLSAAAAGYRDTRVLWDAPPVPPECPTPIEHLETEAALRWLDKMALRINEAADAAVCERSPDGFKGDWSLPRVSRQNISKASIKTRAIGTFVRSLVQSMQRMSGAPNYVAVSKIAEIAFPSIEIDPERIRAFCKPSTRAARRRKSGTLAE